MIKRVSLSVAGMAVVAAGAVAVLNLTSDASPSKPAVTGSVPVSTQPLPPPHRLGPAVPYID